MRQCQILIKRTGKRCTRQATMFPGTMYDIGLCACHEALRERGAFLDTCMQDGERDGFIASLAVNEYR